MLVIEFNNACIVCTTSSAMVASTTSSWDRITGSNEDDINDGADNNPNFVPDSDSK